jgi:hypothetical protein
LSKYGRYVLKIVYKKSCKPMAGINLATMTKTTDSKMRVGLAAGAELAVGAAENFEVSAGVLYSMQGVKGKGDLDGLTYKLDYINIPILANFYVTRGLAIKAGVLPGFNVTKKISADGVSADIDGVKGFAFSVPVGLSNGYVRLSSVPKSYLSVHDFQLSPILADEETVGV